MNHSEQFPSCNPKGPQFSTVVLVCKLLSKKNTNSSLWFRCEIQLLSLLSALKHQGNRFSTHYLVIWNRIHEGNGRLLTATREHRDSPEELVILGLKFGAFPAPSPSQHADVLQSEYIDFPFRSKQQPNLDRCVEWLAKQPRPRFQNLYRQNKVGKVQFQEFFFPFPPPAAPRALGMCLDPPLLSSQPKTSRTNPGRRPAVSLIATSPSLAFYNTGSSFLSSSKL